MPAAIKHYKAASNLGGAISANEVVTASLGELFTNTTSQEAIDGKTEYVCIYIKNTGDSLAEVVKQWILSNTPSADTVDAIGVGASGINAAEAAIANKNTAPSGVVFSAAADEANCLSYPDLAVGDFHALWIKRVTQPNASSIAVDNSVFRTKVDTL